MAANLLSIGQLAARTGLSVSAIRFYEAKGLIAPLRNPGGQRRFARADIRLLSFVLIAQRLGTVEGVRRLTPALALDVLKNQPDWVPLNAR